MRFSRFMRLAISLAELQLLLITIGTIGEIVSPI